MQTDPETIAALVKRLRKNGPVHCQRNVIDYEQFADMIEALQAEIASARQEGFAAGVEAAAKVCDERGAYE